MANLNEASYQWQNRPDDQRFASLKDMYDACKRYAASAQSVKAYVNALRVEAQDGDLKLVGKSEKPADLTHYSFGQLAGLIKAPAAYLRSLPATLAAQNLNHGLKARADRLTDVTEGDDKVNLLLHANGHLVARAITTESYDRVWNYEVIERICARLMNDGWVVPPARPCREGQAGARAATKADILPNQGDFGLAIKEGDMIAPAGLYASDHDMFAFLAKMGDTVSDGDKLLNRGAFIRNSEVGDGSLRVKTFLVDQICGNHICWGVSKVTEISVRHMKSKDVEHGNTLQSALTKWNVFAQTMPTAEEMEQRIAMAKNYVIAATKEDVLENLFKFAKAKNLTALSRKALAAGYEVAEQNPRYGNPNTAWAMVNGLTEVSQKTGYTDVRTDMDEQAGRIMEIF